MQPPWLHNFSIKRISFLTGHHNRKVMRIKKFYDEVINNLKRDLNSIRMPGGGPSYRSTILLKYRQLASDKSGLSDTVPKMLARAWLGDGDPNRSGTSDRPRSFGRGRRLTFAKAARTNKRDTRRAH